MRARSIMGLALVSMLILPLPSQAEYLLNCRLMDHRNPNFKRWCSSEVEQKVVRHCSAQGLCVARVQNFGSVYSKSVVASKGEPIRGGIVSGAKVSSVATTSTVGNTVGSTLSGSTNTVGSLSNSTHNTLSGATNTVGGLLK
jgi:hypothetical protein